MDYFFHIQGLAVGYGGEAVVENIEVSLPAGKILTLIGPNGCGKSTILKTIAKQLQTVAGLIMVEGIALHSISSREMARRTALVLTERPQPELMSCGEVAALGRYPYTGRLGILSAQDHAKVDEALQLVDALELKDRPFAEISDGQRQRIMLARALCQEPQIILLDEPTSFLDIRYGVELVDILRYMADQHGLTVIMSLHELNYAQRVSDLVMGIKQGRMLYLDQPRHIFTEEVISHLFDLPPTTYQQLFGGL